MKTTTTAYYENSAATGRRGILAISDEGEKIFGK